VTVAFTNIFTLNGNFSFGKNKKLQGAKSLAVGVLTDLGDAMSSQKKPA